MTTFKSTVLAILLYVISAVSWADIVVPMYLVAAKAGEGKPIGSITIKTAQCGILFVPNLTGLSPGVHGFHIHQNPSCDDFAHAAGDHFDPNKTQHHEGPYASGHRGDLPVLVVDANGKATLPSLAPHLTLADVQGHSLMIH